MKILFIGTFIFPFVLFFGSCQKKESATLQNSKSEYFITKSGNFSNPYDYIGQQHNEILNIFSSSENNFNSRIDYYNAGVNYLNENYGAGISPVNQNDELINALNSIQGRSLTDQLDLMLNQNLINQKQFSYLSNIGVIVNDKNSIEIVLSKLIELEENVNNDLSLNTDEKRIIFMATSVAKYSSQYWWQNSENYLDLSKSKCKKYACIALCDVVGVIAGAPLVAVSGGGSLIVFGALGSLIGKCCICCPGSCPNVHGLC